MNRLSETDNRILNMSETDNLLLNMSGGLLPEYLSKREIQLLIDKFGEDWFIELGYSEPAYNKPKLEGEIK